MAKNKDKIARAIAFQNKTEVDSVKVTNINLINNRTDYNIEEFVLSADNGDYSLAFNRAINFLKTNNLRVLKLPTKSMEFRSNLTEIDFELQLLGKSSSTNGKRTYISDKRTESDTPLLTFKGTARGFRISDIFFYGNNLKNNCLSFERNAGWDYHMERCTFEHYKGTVLKTAASDGYINGCMITTCGTSDPLDTVISYAIQFEDGANMQHFNDCHIEHCRFFANISYGFMNDFTNCKFEQSGAGLAYPSTLSPIEINGIGTITKELSFNNCTFIPVSERAYIDAKTLTSIDDVPYFININDSDLTSTNNVSFNGCVSRIGLGSSSFTTPSGYTALIKSRAKTIINGCMFNTLTGSRSAIDLKTATVSGNIFNFTFSDPIAGYEALLPNNGQGISVSNYSNVTGNIFNAEISGTVDASYHYAVRYDQLDNPVAIGATAANNSGNMPLYHPSFRSDLRMSYLTLSAGVTGYVKYAYEMSKIILQISLTASTDLIADTKIATLPRFVLQDYSYLTIRNTTTNTDVKLYVDGTSLRLIDPVATGDVIKGAGIII